jgi:hypothetical protein
MRMRLVRRVTRMASMCAATVLLGACAEAPVSSAPESLRLARVPLLAEFSVAIDSPNGRAVIRQRVMSAAGDSVFWSLGASDGSSPQAFTSNVLRLVRVDDSRTVFDDMSSGIDFPFRNYSLGRSPTVALRAGAHSEAALDLSDRQGTRLPRGRYRATVVSLIVGSSRADTSGARAMQGVIEASTEFEVP